MTHQETHKAVTALIVVAGLLLSLPMATASARGQTEIAACQRIAQAGRYVLTSDLAGAPLHVSVPPEMFVAYTGDRTIEQTCLEIAVSNVTLDCQGHTLIGSGDPSSPTAGIYIAGTPEAALSGVRVEGCAVTAHGFGLYASRLDGGTIAGNQIRRNRSIGFYVTGVVGTHVSGNTAEGNDPDGFLLIGATDVTVSDNSVFYNRMRGITFEGCQRCVAHDNESYSHGVLGFGIYGSKNMTLHDNVAYDNRYHGFAILHEAGSATFRDNESYGNEGVGFYLESTNGNDYVDNITRDNGLDGVALFKGSMSNTFVGNTLRTNIGFGAFSDSPIDPAVLADNAFGGNALGAIGSADPARIDWCRYTGGNEQGRCDPVFEGGPNLKDPHA